MTMLPVSNWSVVTEDNLQEFIDRNRERNGTLVFYAMDPALYENFSLNLAEIWRYVNQQAAVISYYESAAQTEKKEDEPTTPTTTTR